MKKLLIVITAILFMCGTAFAANDTDTNVKFFDTTTGATLTGIVKVIAIFWVSDEGSGLDIAADDDLLVSDGNGHRIIGKRAESAGDDLGIVFPQPFVTNGLVVTTMDGGVCYVYVQ